MGDAKIEVRVLVGGLRDPVTAGAVGVRITRRQGGSPIELRLAEDRSNRFHLVGGYQQQFAGEVDAARVGEGRFLLLANVTNRGRPRSNAQAAFTVGVPPKIDDLLTEHVDPGGANRGGIYRNAETIDEVHQAVRDAAHLYANEKTGQELTAGLVDDPYLYENVLQTMFHRPDWLPASAPYAARVGCVSLLL